MNKIESQLTLLDEQLEGYEPLSRWLIIASACIGILFTSWMFLISDTLEELSTLQKQTRELETKIIQSSPQAYQDKITQINQTLQKRSEAINEWKQKKELLAHQLSETKGLLFDNRHYAKMLDLLLERSVGLGLKIELMESVDSNKVFFGKVKQMKTLTVVGTGKFPAIASFLSFIEDQSTLVQIKNVEIRSDEDHPRFKAVIVYMGVEL